MDWGDFGPCQDCSEDHSADDRCPNFVDCEQCEAKAELAEGIKPIALAALGSARMLELSTDATFRFVDDVCRAAAAGMVAAGYDVRDEEVYG